MVHENEAFFLPNLQIFIASQARLVIHQEYWSFVFGTVHLETQRFAPFWHFFNVSWHWFFIEVHWVFVVPRNPFLLFCFWVYFLYLAFTIIFRRQWGCKTLGITVFCLFFANHAKKTDAQTLVRVLTGANMIVLKTSKPSKSMYICRKNHSTVSCWVTILECFAFLQNHSRFYYSTISLQGKLLTNWYPPILPIPIC